MRAMRMKGDGQAGTMIIEVLFTVMILFIALMALAGMLISVIQGNSSSGQLTRVAAAGQQRMEALRSLSYDNLTAGMADDGLSPDGPGNDGIFTARDTVNGITRTWTVQQISPGLSEITVTLTWTDRLGKSRQRVLQTLRAS